MRPVTHANEFQFLFATETRYMEFRGMDMMPRSARCSCGRAAIP